MNKKFSTLMAGLMLASAFSVNAAEYKNGKYYLLGDDTNVISVVSTPGNDYGKLEKKAKSAVNGNLSETRNALWKVELTAGTQGNTPKYRFVNVATGLYLSVPVPAGINGSEGTAEIAGTMMEWYNGTASTGITKGSPLMSYVSANQVVYMDLDDDGVLVVKKNTPIAAEADAWGIMPYTAQLIENLTAGQLNQELDANDRDGATNGYFSLSFNRDVTDDASTNLFAATELQAEQVVEAGTPTNYVRLMAKDVKADDAQAYIVVDTAYYAGSENLAKLVKFTYAASNTDAKHPNGVLRYDESYQFNFSYDPTEDRLLIRSRGYLTRTDNGKPVKVTDPNLIYGDYEYTPYSAWTIVATDRNDAAELGSDDAASAPFIRLVELSSVRELTVSNVNSTADIDAADDEDAGMNTIVKIGIQNLYEPTTIADGLYLIRLVENDVRTAEYENASEGDYYVASLGGNFGYTEQARNQDFQHMPAAQWYVQKQGSSSTAPITITNREFSDQGISGNLQAFKSGNNVFFTINNFSYLGSRDTLEFIKVTNTTDAHLGYKYVSKEDASVQIYNFNYLHGLSLENGLNTPIDKDSLVRVDETGEKVAFRLVPVVVDDSYGIQLDAKKTGVANLVRNVYYVKAYDNSKFEGDRYLKYDYASKKYVMSKYAQPFFLKENNCIDGIHYYALVEANLCNLQWWTYEDGTVKTVYSYLDKDGQPIVLDDTKDIALYDLEGNRLIATEGVNKGKYAYINKSDLQDNQYNERICESIDYASYRISVDDNTLDLFLTDINNQSSWWDELRVSAFDAKEIDSPLYRRFNGAAPETYGDTANSPLNLKFFRHNNNAEYLFENYASENKYRDGIKDQSISFLGVNNAFQFPESETRSYTMFVDTAYVRGNTIMPQYLIGIRPEVVLGDTIWCNATSAHHHETLADSLACDHTVITAGFTRAMYLFNAEDSISAGNYDYQGKAAYGAAGYTRLAFRDAVHANDTLYILNPGVTNEQLIKTNLKDEDLFAWKIALDNNKHKNVVFQFRLIDDENNRFLIESEAEQDGKAVLNKDLKDVCIAPMKGGWVKIQNGVPVIARFDTFNEAIAQAEIFDVNDEIKYDATANDEIAVEGVTVVAGNGQVTIMGAAGKNVTITNILGKVIASQVIASDNATIAVPAGIVAVAVEGEAAVKAIVK